MLKWDFDFTATILDLENADFVALVNWVIGLKGYRIAERAHIGC